MKFEGASAGTGYRVKVESSYVAQSRGSDADAPLEWHGAHRACIGGKCLLYLKHCGTDRQGLHCRYDFSRADAPVGNQFSITVTAADETTLAAAEEHIAVDMGEGLKLPLALMTARSTNP